MGLFDRWFGRGAAQQQEQQPNAQQRFDELKQKYQTALTVADQQQIRFYNFHLQDDKLYVKGTAPSQEAKDQFWNQIKIVDPNFQDVVAEVDVQESASGGNGGGQSYTVKSGDTLSKISKQFYGDDDEFMRIFYANRDKLSDPDKIQAGQQLVIPADDNSSSASA